MTSGLVNVLPGHSRQPIQQLVLERWHGFKVANVYFPCRLYRPDAVDIVEMDCAIVTSVDIDHAGGLGDTREKVDFEKAGTSRAGKPAICGDPAPPQSLIDHAQVSGADLCSVSRFETLAEAILDALRRASEHDRILVFESVSAVAGVMAYCESRNHRDGLTGSSVIKAGEANGIHFFARYTNVLG